jgi:hypothetical protein
VSAFSDAFAALKNVLLMQDKLERMQREIESTAGDLRGLRDYAVEIDKRVSRIEGVMEGYQRASAAPRRPRLPKT